MSRHLPIAIPEAAAEPLPIPSPARVTNPAAANPFPAAIKEEKINRM